MLTPAAGKRIDHKVVRTVWFMLEIQVYWQGMIELDLMGQITND